MEGNFQSNIPGGGQDISPEFVIKNLSSDAKTLAITLEDISHPIKNFTHWLIWNIPAADRIKGDIPTGRIVPAFRECLSGHRIRYSSVCRPEAAEREKAYLPLYSLFLRL